MNWTVLHLLCCVSLSFFVLCLMMTCFVFSGLSNRRNYSVFGNVPTFRLFVVLIILLMVLLESENGYFCLVFIIGLLCISFDPNYASS